MCVNHRKPNAWGVTPAEWIACAPCLAGEVERLNREVAELREALGSLQELLAKQIAVPEGDDIFCAACGLANDRHTERCPVARGLAIIEAAFKPHAQGTTQP